MPNNYQLTDLQIKELQTAHRFATDKRYADRIKTVYLLASGWPVSRVAEALMIDRDTARHHFRRYRKGGLTKLRENEAGGSEIRLCQEQLKTLDEQLQVKLYLTAKEVAHFIKQTWQVSYTESGINQLLHRLGFVFKKPKLIPGKADAQKQREFLEEYKNIKENKSQEDAIYFMDATHPHHNPVAGYGWIKRGRDHEIRTNTGRRRININGAISTEDMRPVIRYDDSINAQSTLQLFEQIEQVNQSAKRIYIICDNARYYRSKLVKAYLENSKIELIFLPPYAPNLNLIERYWKFFKKKILYAKYYETFGQFKAACDSFFDNWQDYQEDLKSLLTENFQIIGDT